MKYRGSPTYKISANVVSTYTNCCFTSQPTFLANFINSQFFWYCLLLLCRKLSTLSVKRRQELGGTEKMLLSKAVANYYIRNGRAQNSLLSSLLCSAIDWFKWSNEFCTCTAIMDVIVCQCCSAVYIVNRFLKCFLKFIFESSKHSRAS